MRRGPAAVEQPRRGQQEGTRADGRDAARAPGRPADRGDDGEVLGGGPGALAPRDEQRVDVAADVGQGEVRQEREAARAAHGRGPGGPGDLDPVGARDHPAGGVQDLERPREVERLQAVGGDEDDAAGGHAAMVPRQAHGGKDHYRAIPATSSRKPSTRRQASCEASACSAAERSKNEWGAPG